jgi:hypothetical protein
LGEIEERQEWVPEAATEVNVEEKAEEKSILGSILNKFK